MAITAFLSRSPGLLNRGPMLGHGSHSSIFSPTATAQSGPEGPLCWVLVLSTASYLQLIWASCRRGYIIIWHPLCFLRASQFRTQFNPSTVKVISWYSSTGCTCHLHRCISYFDSLAGSEVNIQQYDLNISACIIPFFVVVFFSHSNVYKPWWWLPTEIKKKLSIIIISHTKIILIKYFLYSDQTMKSKCVRK